MNDGADLGHGGSTSGSLAARQNRRATRLNLSVAIVPGVLVLASAAVVDGRQLVLQVLALFLVSAPVVGGLIRSEGARVGMLYLIHLGAFLLFVLLRSVADESSIPVYVQYPVIADRVLASGQLPSRLLQDLMYTAGEPRWWDRLVLLVYGSHFVNMWSVAFVLWLRRMPQFATYMISSAFLYLLALPIHFLLPTAPPWLAAHWGRTEPVARIFFEVGRSLSPEMYDAGMDLSGNDVAAMPSIHLAVTWLIMRAAWSHGSLARGVACSYLIVMLWAIVYGGEHYVVDAFGGVLLAEVAWRLGDRFERRHATIPGEGRLP